jgi:hypothetical protein
MKKIGLLLCLIILLTAGCAASALRLSSGDFKSLQTTAKGDPTNGCLTTSLLGSSGVVGGTSKAVVTWGTVSPDTINWCLGK